MKMTFKILLVCTALVMPVLVHAQAKSGAAAGGGAGAAKGAGGRYELFSSAGYLGLGASSSQYDLSPGINWVAFPKISWLLLGAEITYQKIQYRGGSTASTMLLGGITVDLAGVSAMDSAFLSLGLASRSGATDLPDEAKTDPNGMGFYFIVGKRFALGGQWTLRPSLGVVAAGTTGMVFRPFAVGYHF